MTFLLGPERSQEAKLCEGGGKGAPGPGAANENMPRGPLTPLRQENERLLGSREGRRQRKKSMTLVKTGKPTLFGTPETSMGTTVMDGVLRKERGGGQLSARPEPVEVIANEQGGVSGRKITKRKYQRERGTLRTSLVVQRLGAHTPSAGGLSSIPGQGTRSHKLQLTTTTKRSFGCN